MNKPLYSIGEAALLLGVAVVTLRRWANEHKLPFERTLGGHRRFKHETLVPSKNNGLTLLYARVSSRDQKSDLLRQLAVLEEHAASQNWENTQSIQAIGSGLNTRTPGLKKLVALVLSQS